MFYQKCRCPNHWRFGRKNPKFLQLVELASQRVWLCAKEPQEIALTNKKVSLHASLVRDFKSATLVGGECVTPALQCKQTLVANWWMSEANRDTCLNSFYFLEQGCKTLLNA